LHQEGTGVPATAGVWQRIELAIKVLKVERSAASVSFKDPMICSSAKRFFMPAFPLESELN
jgi:hypothetical protein